ncbi:MAG: response regulator transcription factor [Pirellulaceae bacterium]
MEPNHTVFVVDDDANVRLSVCALVNSMGWRAQGFASAEDFLANHVPAARGVAVIDLRMPGMSGLELQAELARRNPHLPVIVLTAYARTPTTVRAIQAGAVAMIDKPYHDNDLWDAIRKALEQEEADWKAGQQRRNIQERVASLTAEERRVADLVVKGRPNKTIAQELDLSVRTVEKRRHNVLAKMNVESVAALVEAFLTKEDPPT